MGRGVQQGAGMCAPGFAPGKLAKAQNEQWNTLLKFAGNLAQELRCYCPERCYCLKCSTVRAFLVAQKILGN